ncbi:hypothetical protein [Nodosilinea nodulosa]|uniref:hypothetical protein n=1 Tax=Nodosilinea nodulosa TaxID=416001 RepID=UPI0002DAA4E9|nr:hypothetical protein [Nodosilinea nodulosa]
MAYLSFLSRSAAVAIAAFSLLAPAALAQTAGTDPDQPVRVNADEGFTSADDTNNVFGDSSSPFDLIHRAVLANDRTPSDFRREHRNQINAEASNFRTLQQDALRRQQAQSQGAGTTLMPPETEVAPATGE